MKYSTILFDLDGTLLDTLDDLTESVNMVLHSEGCQQRTREEICEFVGGGVKSLLQQALPSGTADVDVLRCLTSFREIYSKNMRNQTKPYEGILDVLKKLKEKGIKIGVVSNKPDEMTREICSWFFENYVDVAIGDTNQRKRKPEPDNVFEAMNLLSAEQSRTLYIGDSNVDIKTAKNAGLDCMGVTWGFRSRESILEEGPNYMIDEPGQLVKLIESLD